MSPWRWSPILRCVIENAFSKGDPDVQTWLLWTLLHQVLWRQVLLEALHRKRSRWAPAEEELQVFRPEVFKFENMPFHQEPSPALADDLPRIDLETWRRLAASNPLLYPHQL